MGIGPNDALAGRNERVRPAFVFPMERTWILVGMMGAGQSSIGRLLADRARREFDDPDGLLVGYLASGVSAQNRNHWADSSAV